MYSPQKFTGELTGTGNDITVTLGTKPLYIKVVNATSLTEYEYIEGVTKKLHYDGTKTVMTSGIVIKADDYSFTIPAAENAANDAITYFVIG